MSPISMSDFKKLNHASHEVVFFYTPLCGTCKLGERMLGFVEEALGNQAPPIYSGRVAEWQELVQSWKIESVPALVFLKNGEIDKKLYAFHSVPDLLEAFNLFIKV